MAKANTSPALGPPIPDKEKSTSKGPEYTERSTTPTRP